MKRGAVIGIVIAAVVAIAAGGVAWWLLNRPPATPESVVQDFLGALEEGDGARALSLIDHAPPGGLDIAALYDSAAETPGDTELIGVEPGTGGAQRAEVVFTLGGERHEASLDLVETRDGWRVSADALGELSLSTTIGDTVAVGEVLVPAAAEPAVLPARYEVSAAPRSLLAGSATAIVLPGVSVRAAVEASVTPTAIERAQEQLDAYARECARTADRVPENCGLRVPWAADLTTLDRIAFRIERTPQIALSEDASGFAATGGVIVATATGTTRDGISASFTYRTDAWALRGSVDFEGDTLVLSVH